MITLNLDMYLSAGVAVVSLMLGHLIKKRSQFMRSYCIPEAVIGGTIVSIVILILYMTNSVQLEFDTTLQNIAMLFFFTTVGFHIDLKTLKQGGKPLLFLTLCVALMIILQNALSVGMAVTFSLDANWGLCLGSIPLIGGHGTASAFGPELEKLGIEGATTLCLAAATFGLLMGSFLGGPLASKLINKNKLAKESEDSGNESMIHKNEEKGNLSPSKLAIVVFITLLSIAIGSYLNRLLVGTSIVFPEYIFSMIFAAVIRNLLERFSDVRMPMEEVNCVGEISLMLFLGMALISMKLWMLGSLAMPFVIILVAQTALILAFAYFLFFKIMGNDYDAAVMTGGFIGFGMGAIANAMANMKSIAGKYRFSPKAFFLIPVVGVMFTDLINSAIVITLMNVL